ncbi:MAG: hypothetical protein JJ964_07795 [Rhizobiales bacterium]|nr:hypothetical protein [Hyphomicrobiales bacterium]
MQPHCAALSYRSTYPYSLRSVRADLVRRAARSASPCPDAEVASLLLRIVSLQY